MDSAAQLMAFVSEGRAIVHNAHEVSRLLHRVRRACYHGNYALAEETLIQALALHQTECNKVSRLLRRAEATIAQLFPGAQV